MKGLIRFCLLSGLFVATLALPACAQVDYSTATLRGTVSDPQGAVITKATVTVTNPSTGFTKTVSVRSDGSYVIPVLQPGNYQITVQAAGFEKVVVQTFSLTVGNTSVFDVFFNETATTE